MTFYKSSWCGISRSCLGVLAGALILALAGESCAQAPTWTAPKAACATLQGRNVPASEIGIASGDAVVTAATVVPGAQASAVTLTGRSLTVTAIPEYCKVVGEIRPIDPHAPNINFQVNLPSQWNGKAVQLGGSGMNGFIPGSLNNHFNAPESQPAGVGAPIARGFMEMGSDSGHAGMAPAWVLNAEAAANLAHLQVKKTHDVAVALARAYYGAPPKRVYFMGSSQGGREGLIAAQKYPADYDGVFSQVPVMSFTSIALNPTLLAQKQTGAGWIPPDKVALIGGEVLRQCDALDGAADGVVSNYTACNARFVDLPASRNPWSAITCKSGAPDGSACLSEPQIATLRAIHSLTDYGFPLAFGAPGFAGWGVGGESVSWLNERNQPKVETYTGGLGSGWWKGLVAQNADARALEFDPSRFRAQMLALSAQSDATDPNLTAFYKRGGKLLLKGNTGDYTANYRELIRYFEQVKRVMGGRTADAFIRLYIAPGQGHSMSFNPVQKSATGGEIPSQVDMLGVLDAWVSEKKTPPDALMLEARDLNPPYAMRSSRPICRYPQYPHLTGGDPANGGSYKCRQP